MRGNQHLFYAAENQELNYGLEYEDNEEGDTTTD